MADNDIIITISVDQTQTSTAETVANLEAVGAAADLTSAKLIVSREAMDRTISNYPRVGMKADEKGFIEGKDSESYGKDIYKGYYESLTGLSSKSLSSQEAGALGLSPASALMLKNTEKSYVGFGDVASQQAQRIAEANRIASSSVAASTRDISTGLNRQIEIITDAGSAYVTYSEILRRAPNLASRILPNNQILANASDFMETTRKGYFRGTGTKSFVMGKEEPKRGEEQSVEFLTEIEARVQQNALMQKEIQASAELVASEKAVRAAVVESNAEFARQLELKTTIASVSGKKVSDLSGITGILPGMTDEEKKTQTEQIVSQMIIPAKQISTLDLISQNTGTNAGSSQAATQLREQLEKEQTESDMAAQSRASISGASATYKGEQEVLKAAEADATATAAKRAYIDSLRSVEDAENSYRASLSATTAAVSSSSSIWQSLKSALSGVFNAAPIKTAAQESEQSWTSAASKFMSNTSNMSASARNNFNSIKSSGRSAFNDIDNAAQILAKHGTASFDELARGQKGAFASTVIATVRDLGVVRGVISSITPAGAAAAAGLGILAAGLVSAARAALDVGEATNSTAGSLALLGQSSQISSSRVEHWQAYLIRGFGESFSSSKNMIASLNQLGGAATHLRPKLLDLGEALGYFRNIGGQKGTEEIVRAYSGGAASALKFAEGLRAISPVQEENIKSLMQAGQEEKALDVITQALVKRFGEAGDAAKKAEESLTGWMVKANDPITLLIEGVMKLKKELFGLHIDPTKIAPELPAVQRIGQQTTVEATPQYEKRLTIQTQINNEKQYELDIENRLKTARENQNYTLTQGGPLKSFKLNIVSEDATANIKALEQELDRAKEAAYNFNLELAKIHTPTETENFQVSRQEISQRRIVAQRENDQKTLVSLAAEEANLEASYAGNTASAKAAAATKIKQAEMTAAQDALQADLDHYKASAAASHRGAEGRVQDAQFELQRLAQANEQNTAQYRSLQIQLSTAKRQQLDEQFQDFKDEQLREIKQADYTVAQIRAVYAKMRQEATATGQLPRVQTQLKVEEQSTVQTKQQSVFQTATTDTSAFESNAQRELNIRKQLDQIAVDQHKMSKQKMLSDEQAYTAQVGQEVEKRIVAEELANQASRDDKIKALEDLARAQEEYTEKVIQLQAQVTQAIEEENKKQVQAFVQGFDQIGSSFNSVMDGLLDGSIRATTVIQQTEVVASNGVVTWSNTTQRESALMVAGLQLVNAAGKAVLNTVLDLGSQAAAKYLAPALGVDIGEGETPTLSGVLGKWVANMLGFGTKKPDQTAMQNNTSALDKLSGIVAQLNALLAQKGVITGQPTPQPGQPIPAASSLAAGYATAPYGYATGLPAVPSTAASPEVLSQLQISGLPPEAQAFLGAISGGEGSSFRTMYGGGQYQGSLAAFPNLPTAYGPGGQPTHPFGAFQFEPGTYAGISQQTGMTDVMPQSQIGNAWALAQQDFSRSTGGQNLLSALQGGNLQEVQNALQTTWPGGANSGFSGRYAANLQAVGGASTPPMAANTGAPISIDIAQVGESDLATAGTGALPVDTSTAASLSTPPQTPTAPIIQPPIAGTNLAIGGVASLQPPTISTQPQTLQQPPILVTSQNPANYYDYTNPPRTPPAVQPPTSSVSQSQISTAVPTQPVTSPVTPQLQPASTALSIDVSSITTALQAAFTQGATILSQAITAALKIPTSPNAPVSTTAAPNPDLQSNTTSINNLTNQTQAAAAQQQAALSQIQQNNANLQTQSSSTQTTSTDLAQNTTALSANTTALTALTSKLSQSTASVGAASSTQPATSITTPTSTTTTGGGTLSSGQQLGSGLSSTLGSAGTLLGPFGALASAAGNIVGAFTNLASGIPKVFEGLTSLLGIGGGAASAATQETGAAAAAASLEAGATAAAATTEAGAAAASATLEAGAAAAAATMTAGGAGSGIGSAVGAAATVAIVAAQHGMPEVTNDMLVYVHKGEMIVPPEPSEALRGMMHFATGTDFVPTTGPAIVHKGEIVVPELQSKRLRTAADRAGFSIGRYLGQFESGSDEIKETGIATLHKGEMVVPARMAADLRLVTGSAGKFGGIVDAVRKVGDQGSPPNLPSFDTRRGDLLFPSQSVEPIRPGEGVSISGDLGKYLGKDAVGTQPRGATERLSTLIPGSEGVGSSIVNLSQLLTHQLPKLDLGAWEISRDTAAVVHRGEQVIPANYAEGLRAAMSGKSVGGSQEVHLSYAPTIHAPGQPSLDNMLTKESQTMLGWINARMRDGTLKGPP